MLKAEIIAVGTELLMGQVVNTDSNFIAGRLCAAGIDSYYQTVVGDNAERLTETLARASERSDIVILSGGLGPTDDDLTKETLAEFLGLKLVFDQASLDNMKNYFEKNGRIMPESCLNQAYMPEGCMIFKNDFGTAPGCVCEKDGRSYVILPGPPSELCPMFDGYVMPYLLSLGQSPIYSRVLRLYGIGESAAADRIKALMDAQDEVTIAPYAKECELTLRVSAKAETETAAREKMRATIDAIYRELGEYIYGEGDDQSLAGAVVALLKEKRLTVSFAESCTGGLLAELLTSVPGSSAVFEYGFVTYANRAKTDLLGVSRETLSRHGAVSAQCAGEMARGARARSAADLGVSITGIAGPGGGTEEKPVGTVYIALAGDKGCAAQKLGFAGGRDRIRQRSAFAALNAVRKYLLEGKLPE